MRAGKSVIRLVARWLGHLYTEEMRNQALSLVLFLRTGLTANFFPLRSSTAPREHLGWGCPGAQPCELPFKSLPLVHLYFVAFFCPYAVHSETSVAAVTLLNGHPELFDTARCSL